MIAYVKYKAKSYDDSKPLQSMTDQRMTKMSVTFIFSPSYGYFFLQHNTVFFRCESQSNSYTITKQP